MSLILLTGSTGFVGRQILRELQNRGHQLRLVIRKDTELRIANMDGVESIVYTHDLFLESRSWWATACDGVEILINCAWYVEPGCYLDSSKNLDCLVGTIAMAQGAVNAGVKRFIGLGTCFEYEMCNRPLSIHDPLKPLSLYAATKASVYMILSQYFIKNGISFAWCRLFYLFGEGEDPRRLFPYLHKQMSLGELALLTDGMQVRDFLNVVCASEQIVAVTFSDMVGAVNICSGVPTTLRMFAENIADKYNARSLLRFGSRQENLFDPPYVVGVKGSGS